MHNNHGTNDESIEFGDFVSRVSEAEVEMPPDEELRDFYTTKKILPISEKEKVSQITVESNKHRSANRVNNSHRTRNYFLMSLNIVILISLFIVVAHLSNELNQISKNVELMNSKLNKMSDQNNAKVTQISQKDTKKQLERENDSTIRDKIEFGIDRDKVSYRSFLGSRNANASFVPAVKNGIIWMDHVSQQSNY